MFNRFILAIVLTGVFFVTPAQARYVIGVDDILYIQLYGDPSMTGHWEVREDGNIKYPLLGEVKSAGYTLSEFNDSLTEKLKKYYQDPQVTVTVGTYGSCKVFVLGQVARPGVYYYKREASVLEILLLAGGALDSGKKSSVVVIRQLESTPQIMRVNIDKVIDEGLVALNIPVRPHDIVFVPKTFITNLNDFLNKIYPSLRTFMTINSIYRMEWTRP